MSFFGSSNGRKNGRVAINLAYSSPPEGHLIHSNSTPYMFYNQPPNMVRLTFYTKDGCRLCDQAEAFINSYKEEYGIRVERVEITSDPELYDLYRYDVPVVEFEGGRTLHGRIKRDELLRHLDEYKE